MFTARMIKLFAVVLDHDADKVTEELLRAGVMQFINITEIEHEWQGRLNDVSPQVSLAKIAMIRKRIEGFLTPLGIYPKTPGEIDLENRRPVDLEEENKNLDRIADELQEIRKRQRTIQQEILKLEGLSRQIEMYGPGLTETVVSSRYSFITIRVGKVHKDNYQRLTDEMKDIPSVLLTIHKEEDAHHLFLIFMKRDTERARKILDRAGWAEAELSRKLISLKPDITLDLDEKIKQLQEEQESLRREAKESMGLHSRDLNRMWVQLRVNELFYKVQSYFKRSSRTMIFSGWLPASKQSSLAEKIIHAASGRCFLEWHEPEKDTALEVKEKNVPVKFRNPKFLAPFQMLVTNFGVPEYGTVDPTPFVMFSYLMMFGLMFADVGQGAVLALAGLFGMFFFKGKKEAWQNISKLIVWCGFSSMVTGVLFGSYFGMAWCKPLWFDFHGIISSHPNKQSYINDIFDILSIAIYFGIGIIGFGLLFNWINLFIKRRWIDLVLDKGGVLGAWIYFGGIYIARYMIMHEYRQLPGSGVIFWLVGLPALLLYAKGPFNFVHKRKKGTGKEFTLMTPLNFGMEWIVELLEVFAGYLSNTLSFMRVAGLGIAHVSLMLSFFELARMAQGQGAAFNLWSLLILITGNILVIGLEGLTAGVQALRLNYYEFFTKFFRGSGEVYLPVSLKSRD